MLTEEDRERMVATQIEARGITDPLVRQATFASDGGALPIGLAFVALIGAEGRTEGGGT